MKKILKYSVPIAILLAGIVFAFGGAKELLANFGVPLNATSTTQSWISPVRVNGVEQTVVATNFIGTSTNALLPSFFPNLSFTNSTGTSATTTNFSTSIASSTNSWVDRLLTTANLLATGSSTLQNFTGLNSTSTNASTTSLFISGLASSTAFRSNTANIGSLTVGSCTGCGSGLAASSTLLSDNNAFSGLNTFTDLKLVTRATTTQATSTYSYVSGTSTIGTLNVTSLGKNVQVCTANCTWTKADPTLTKIKVTVVGGGGNGGTGGASNVGSGGGAAAVGISWIDVTSTSTVNAVVAAQGGTSRFSTFCVATGGSNGATTLGQPGGAGGTASSCDINMAGQQGGGSPSARTAPSLTSYGASTMYGIGGSATPLAAGLDGTGYGSGGGGGDSGNAGGAGKPGIIIIEW